MSAFVVEDATINRVIGWLNDSENQHELRRILLAAEIESTHADWMDKLGASMFEMNVLAVNQRYGDDQAQEFRPLDYAFHWEMANDVQVLKSLQCWHYQCSEGNVPDRELYKEFAKLKGRIACQIVSRLEAYEKAVWG